MKEGGTEKLCLLTFGAVPELSALELHDYVNCARDCSQ